MKPPKFIRELYHPTALHGIIGNPKPDFPMILQHVATVIQDGDHTIRCDADEICDAIEAFTSATALTEIQTPTAAASSLLSSVSPSSVSLPEPNQTTTTDENQPHSHTPPQRRLPCFVLGNRAA